MLLSEHLSSLLVFRILQGTESKGTAATAAATDTPSKGAATPHSSAALWEALKTKPKRLFCLVGCAYGEEVAGRALTPVKFGAQEVVFLQPSGSMPGLNLTAAEFDQFFESKFGHVASHPLPRIVRKYIAALTGGHVGQSLCVLQWLQRVCSKEIERLVAQQKQAGVEGTAERKTLQPYLLTQLKSQSLIQVSELSMTVVAWRLP
jgi:hypothetical protein